MNIRVRIPGGRAVGHTPDGVRRHAAVSLGRFAGRIMWVDVRISDQNGPKGGVDKECLVRVKLHGGRDIRVSSEGDSTDGVLRYSLDRASRAVARILRWEALGARGA